MPSLTALRGWIPWRARGAAGAAALVVDAHPHCAPAGAFPATKRAMAAWPSKFVTDDSDATFDKLCDDLGIEIYDPDWRAELHRCQLEVQGLYREPLRLIDAELVEAAPLDVEIDDVAPAKPFRPKLDAERAAHAFVEWCRNEGRCGTYSSKQITSLYREHCAAEDFIAVADNVVKGHLAKVPGVVKDYDETHTSASEGHRRHRPARWIIKADATPDNVIDMIFPALPERQKAA